MRVRERLIRSASSTTGIGPLRVLSGRLKEFGGDYTRSRRGNLEFGIWNLELKNSCSVSVTRIPNSKFLILNWRCPPELHVVTPDGECDPPAVGRPRRLGLVRRIGGHLARCSAGDGHREHLEEPIRCRPDEREFA